MWLIKLCIRLMSSPVIDPKKVKRERRVITLNNMVDSPWAGEFGRSYVVRNSINAKESTACIIKTSEYRELS